MTPKGIKEPRTHNVFAAPNGQPCTFIEVDKGQPIVVMCWPVSYITTVSSLQRYPMTPENMTEACGMSCTAHCYLKYSGTHKCHMGIYPDGRCVFKGKVVGICNSISEIQNLFEDITGDLFRCNTGKLKLESKYPKEVYETEIPQHEFIQKYADLEFREPNMWSFYMGTSEV